MNSWRSRIISSKFDTLTNTMFTSEYTIHPQDGNTFTYYFNGIIVILNILLVVFSITSTFDYYIYRLEYLIFFISSTQCRYNLLNNHKLFKSLLCQYIRKYYLDPQIYVLYLGFIRKAKPIYMYVQLYIIVPRYSPSSLSPSINTLLNVNIPFLNAPTVLQYIIYESRITLTT